MLRAGTEELIDDKTDKSNRSTMIELGIGYVINENSRKSENELSSLNPGNEESSGRGSQIIEN